MNPLIRSGALVCTTRVHDAAKDAGLRPQKHQRSRPVLHRPDGRQPVAACGSQAGRCPHTASGRPWVIDVAIEFADEPRAIAFERDLKSGSASPLRSGTCDESTSIGFSARVQIKARCSNSSVVTCQAVRSDCTYLSDTRRSAGASAQRPAGLIICRRKSALGQPSTRRL